MATISKDYLKLHFLVLIWGFTAILGKLLSIEAVETVFYRTFFAVVGLGILIAIQKKSFKIDGRGLLLTILVGFSISAHWILFFASAKVSNISISLAGMSTATLWTAILEPIMLKRRVKGLDFIFGLLIIFGLYIIFQFEFNHALGLFMAVGSAGLSAFFSICNFKLVKKYDHSSISFYELLGAFLGTAAFLPFYAQHMAKNNELTLSLQGWDWLWIIILSQICTVYAFSASVEIMKRVTAFLVNLTVNLEPVYGIILAYFIFGDSEKMSAGFYTGGIIILLTVLSYPVLTRKINK